MKRFWFRAAVLSAAVLCFADRGSAEAARCGGRITRGTVVPCALGSSLAVRSEHDALAAAEGRRLATSPLLPSNPVLTFTGSRRSAAGRDATNWYASLAQELEIAGQRGLRRDAAAAAAEAQRKRILTAERDVAAAALAAFFETLAAREEAALATRLTATAQAVSQVAHAKSAQGLIAPVDADVADAAMIRATRDKLAAERRAAASSSLLATLLGRDPGQSRLDVDGELAPLSGLEDAARGVAAGLPQRPEVEVLDAERRSFEARAAAFRRSRVPNPTLSAFVQNDGFDERVLGLGVSLPVPIPGNVGRTHDGEVAESEALARRAATERERTLRELRLALATAAQAFESRKREVESFSPELLRNAATSLAALGREVESGRLTVREAIVAQQALIELLQSHVGARRELCLASVELARAAGMSLERGIR